MIKGVAGSDGHGVFSSLGHLVDVGRVPGGNQVMFFLREFLDLVDDPGQLIDGAATFCRPAAPLDAVDRADVAPAGHKLFVFFGLVDELDKIHFFNLALIH